MGKRRSTGGRRNHWRKSRKHELGRPPANTKLSSNSYVRPIRVRGGNIKFRALRLDKGTFSWGTKKVTRKTRILGVLYNASNNEMVRTNTLVKSAIVSIDANPFKRWYSHHYGISTSKATDLKSTERTKSNSVKRKLDSRYANSNLDAQIATQLDTG